jgi:hypothetical protein
MGTLRGKTMDVYDHNYHYDQYHFYKIKQKPLFSWRFACLCGLQGFLPIGLIVVLGWLNNTPWTMQALTLFFLAGVISTALMTMLTHKMVAPLRETAQNVEALQQDGLLKEHVTQGKSANDCRRIFQMVSALIAQLKDVSHKIKNTLSSG